ncbi:MAG: hypothetical protein KKF95_06080, partial [Nanoarchaeota archaeon]|nr:hypothetical protein [Nanoarchaeota archaeon]
MNDAILSQAKDLLSKNYSFEEIKQILSNKGLLDSDIDDVLSEAVRKLNSLKEDSNKRFFKQIGWKELFDRIGYGFVSHPFINILFSLSGASYLVIGLVNGLRMIFSLLLSSFLKEFSKLQDLSKKFISLAGVLYGFSFLLMSFGVVLKSPLFYALAFLMGGIGVVIHGELYTGFLKRNLRRECMGGMLCFLSKFGIIITIISMIVSGFIMDLFPVYGKVLSFSLFGFAFNVNIYGYLISFEITAIVFIISGLMLSYIKQKEFVVEHTFSSFLPKFLDSVNVHFKFFFKNKAVFLLALSSLITGMVQMLGNSFYGIFIYDYFKNDFFGGFLNVAVVFSVAALFSFTGPWFMKVLHKHIGISPMLVFGTLLTGMLPLSLVFNPHFLVVVVATALSIIGASILGMAQGFFAKKLLSEQERSVYFSFLGVF